MPQKEEVIQSKQAKLGIDSVLHHSRVVEHPHLNPLSVTLPLYICGKQQ